MRIDREINAIVLAAGKGQRMKSELPKVMFTLCGKTLLSRVLNSLLVAKPKKIFVVLGHGKELVANELKNLSQVNEFLEIPLIEVLQEKQLGTGHATQIALDAFPSNEKGEKDILIIPGDVPLMPSSVIEKICRVHSEGSKDLTILTAELIDPTGYGRIKRDVAGRVVGIVEEKDSSPEEKKIKEVNISVYLVSYNLLKSALASLKSNNAQAEFYLTDIVAFAAKSGVDVSTVSADDPELVLGANSRLELTNLEIRRREEIVNKFLERGVSFEDVNSVYIDEEVVIGVDSFIGAGTRLKGKTRIGEKVKIEGDSLIEDSTIGNSSRLKLGCVIESSEIGEECTIGPFAHLRPGSRLRAKVKVGNFVEVKNSLIGKGSKANHLSYVGDSEVGEEVNIGAGTITCNFDGIKKKSKTTIKDNASIGSNTALVAPVTIGKGAFVGAGSVISQDVPDDALGVERSQQKNILGWAKKKREKLNKG